MLRKRKILIICFFALVVIAVPMLYTCGKRAASRNPASLREQQVRSLVLVGMTRDEAVQALRDAEVSFRVVESKTVHGESLVAIVVPIRDRHISYFEFVITEIFGPDTVRVTVVVVIGDDGRVQSIGRR